MKKLIFSSILTLGAFLAFSSVFAQGPRGSAGVNAGAGLSGEATSTAQVQVRERLNIGTGNGLQVQIQAEMADQSVTSSVGLKNSIEARKKELNNEEKSSSSKARAALESQNKMRIAVHALLSAEDLSGGIGKQVSEMAKKLNDSVSSTIKAELEIKSRGWVNRLLFGGDKENSASIVGQVNQNRETIKKIESLLESCTTCSADLKATLQTQLTAANEEQVNLEADAKAEMESKGVIGFLFGWMKK